MKIKIALLILLLSSCAQKDNAVKRQPHPLFETTDVEFEGKNIAIERINALFQEYKDSLQQVRTTAVAKKFFSQNYFRQFDAFVKLAKEYDSAKLQEQNLLDLYQICELREFILDEKLMKASTEKILEAYLAESLTLGAANAKLVNLVFVDDSHALGINAGSLGMSSIEFDQDDGDWKMNIWGNSVFNKKKEAMILAQRGKSKVEIIKNICPQK